MKILVLGVGGVGEAFSIMAYGKSWVESLVLADYNLERATQVANSLNSSKVISAFVNANDRKSIVDLIKKHKIDLTLNACDPRLNPSIFDACFEANSIYVDMALTLSKPHSEQPYTIPGVPLGSYQFSKAEEWKKKGLLALIGMGVEPGLSNVFAKYAEKNLFKVIDEIGVRDGSNLTVEGYKFSPNFSIWTCLEECLNPPVVWEQKRGFYVTEPFSEPEIFDFPEIGPIECVNVEHEEVILIPRYIKCNRVTFKYALGDEFINYLKTIENLGLNSTKPINVKGVEVSPRDFLSALLPDPAKLGPIMKGKTCAGTWVKGIGKDGKPREVYLYQICDNQDIMKKFGVGAVLWQTAVPALISVELIAKKIWVGAGVESGEYFDPDPFLALMESYGAPYGIKEMTPKVAKI